MVSRIIDTKNSQVWSRLLPGVLALGLFVQLSGQVWLQSGSAHNTQVYLGLLLPALIALVCKLVSRAPIRVSVEYLPWLLFLAWVASSTLWSTNAEKRPLDLAKCAMFIALFLAALAILLRQGEAHLRRALMAGFVVVALGALASLIYQFFMLDKPLAYRAYRIDRLGYGDFANYGWPVIAGIFHGAIAVWVFGYAIDRKVGTKAASVALAMFGVLVLYVVLTYARGAWFGVLGGCLAAVLVQNSRRGWWLSAAFLVLLLGVGMLYWQALTFEVQTQQLSGREAIWQYFFEVMQGHWLFGYGLGTPFVYNWPDGVNISPHAHSLYLQQVYDSGLVSLALMAIGLLGVARKAWRLRDDPWVRLAFPALVFALIAMLTDVERIITRPSVYWTVFWLPVAILLAIPGGRQDRGDDAAAAAAA